MVLSIGTNGRTIHTPKAHLASPCCCTSIGASYQACRLVHRPPPRVHHPVLLSLPNNQRSILAAAAESRATDGVQTDGLQAQAPDSMLLLDEYRALLDTVVDEDQPPPGFLLRAAIVISRHRHPNLDEDAVYKELDRLADCVRSKLDGDGPHYPLHLCRVISRVLYEEEGFSGAHNSYYDPDNSCVNKVLERRVGIPISLSLVYMEVARRVGLEMLGVSLPGHFMLKPKAQDLEILVDAFNGGEVCFLADAEAKLSLLYGRPVKLDEGFVRRKEQVPIRAFLGRWLNNLKHLYINNQEPEQTLAVIRMLRATRPDSIEEIRDEGLYLSQTGHFKESVDCLNLYLKLLPNAEDSEAVREIMRLANGALLNRML